MMSSDRLRPLVLVVEDEALVRIVAAEFLSDRDLEVLEAENGQRALQILEERQDIKVVFTDINMPGKLNGIGLARLIRRRWPKICVIVTTGATQTEKIPPGSHFVPKPYDHAAVADRIYDLAHSS